MYNKELEKGYLEKKLIRRLTCLKRSSTFNKKRMPLFSHIIIKTLTLQDIADYIGDSLGLAQEAQKTNAEIILFAGVHFMLRLAKILNPNKKVLIPDLNAGCSLADSCPPVKFAKFKSEHSDHVVITYINCTAEIKH